MHTLAFPHRHFWLATLCALLLLASSVGAQEHAAPEGEGEAAVDESAVLYAELDPTFVTNVGTADTGRLAYIKRMSLFKSRVQRRGRR